jgi:hypothetical protein
MHSCVPALQLPLKTAERAAINCKYGKGITSSPQVYACARRRPHPPPDARRDRLPQFHDRAHSMTEVTEILQRQSCLPQAAPPTRRGVSGRQSPAAQPSLARSGFSRRVINAPDRRPRVQQRRNAHASELAE